MPSESQAIDPIPERPKASEESKKEDSKTDTFRENTSEDWNKPLLIIQDDNTIFAEHLSVLPSPRELATDEDITDITEAEESDHVSSESVDSFINALAQLQEILDKMHED